MPSVIETRIAGCCSLSAHSASMKKEAPALEKVPTLSVPDSSWAIACTSASAVSQAFEHVLGVPGQRRAGVREPDHQGHGGRHLRTADRR